MSYVFDPARLHEIARKGVGLDHEEMVRVVSHELARSYPGHVQTTDEWVLSLAGGAIGIMTVLHGSLSEYVIIFGTPIGTQGFSGRYRIDIYDFLLSGTMWTYTEEEFREPVRTEPGEMALLRRRQVKGFRISEGSWMLEYGRGPVVTALPFALADAVFSALDVRTVWRTLRVYGRCVVRELLRGKL